MLTSQKKEIKRRVHSMNKLKIWITIIVATLTAGLGTAIGFFPEQKILLSGILTIITAVGTYLNGANNKTS